MTTLPRIGTWVTFLPQLGKYVGTIFTVNKITPEKIIYLTYHSGNKDDIHTHYIATINILTIEYYEPV
jgi:hypothetical protein